MAPWIGCSSQADGRAAATRGAESRPVVLGPAHPQMVVGAWAAAMLAAVQHVQSVFLSNTGIHCFASESVRQKVYFSLPGSRPSTIRILCR